MDYGVKQATRSGHRGRSQHPSHSLDWSIALINSDESSGTLEFSVGGDDAAAFFPVQVSFIAQGSMAGVNVGSVQLVDGGDAVFSQEAILTVENYTVVG